MPKSTAVCLGDIMDAATRNLAGWRCYGSAALGIAGTAQRVRTNAAIDYTIDGIFHTKGSTDNLFIHTDLTVQVADTTKYYALCLDATGTASIIPGPTTLNVDGNTYNVPVNLPVIPVTKCCIGAIKVVTVAVTFTPNTDSQAASGVTTTYYNLSAIPSSGLPA